MVQRFRRAERHKSSAGGVDAKPLEVVQPKAAGIDIGASSPWVRVPAECDEQPVRFGCYTPGLQALVAWLQQGSIGPVAMASPGVDWIALFELLESAGIEVILVNAQHLKHVPGHESLAFSAYLVCLFLSRTGVNLQSPSAFCPLLFPFFLSLLPPALCLLPLFQIGWHCLSYEGLRLQNS
jgi:hypothetical protein